MGSLVSGLKQTPLVQNGSTTNYASPDAAAQAAQIQTIPDVSGRALQTPAINATIRPEVPTSKGAAVSLILRGGLGAIAGAGAPTMGAGAARAFSFLNSIDEAQLEQQRAEQEGQLRAQQLSLIPLQRQQAEAQLANVGAETELRKGQLAALQNKPEADTNSSLQLMLAHASADAIRRGVNPIEDPTVQQIQGVIDAGQKEPTNDPLFREWRKENPNARVADYVRMTHPPTRINTGAAGLPSDQHEALVSGLLDGTLSVQALGRMGAGEKMRLVAEAKKRDPNFDMTTYPSRQRVAEDFASGKAADQIQSFNTFLAHARDLSNGVNDFRATGSPLINKPLNWLRKNSGDPAVASYLAKVQPVADEFMTFLQNNHALTESDKASAAKILDPASSPAQMQAVIKSLAHTAALRLKEVNKRYSNTMKKDYPGLLEPENAQFLQDVGATGGRSPASPSGPAIGAIEGGYRFKGGNPADQNNWEKVR